MRVFSDDDGQSTVILLAFTVSNDNVYFLWLVFFVFAIFYWVNKEIYTFFCQNDDHVIVHNTGVYFV